MRRRISGRAMLASTSVNRMVPVARKISRSRLGNAWPPGSSKGTDSAPASVTAPRIPATVVARVSRAEGCSAILPRRWAWRRLRCTPSISQVQRISSRAVEITTT
ncbi:hypothetical protein D3C78_1477650 [compost metagenome]